MKADQRKRAFEYLPYTRCDGREIPCYRIYPENSPEAFIARTNKDLPNEVQLADARLIAASPQLLNAARLVIDRWSRGDLAEAVRFLDAAVNAAKGGSL